MKVYMVLPHNFEYDDSNYNSAGLGPPTNVFWSKKDAEAAVRRLEIHELRGIGAGILSYNYSGAEGIFEDPEEADKYLRQFGAISGDIHDYPNFSLQKLNDQELSVLIDMMTLELFEIHEAEIEGSFHQAAEQFS